MRLFGRNCFFSCHMLPLCFRQRLATKSEWPLWPRVAVLGLSEGAADSDSNSMCVVFVPQGLHVGIVEPHCQISLKWISKPYNTCLTYSNISCLHCRLWKVYSPSFLISLKFSFDGNPIPQQAPNWRDAIHDTLRPNIFLLMGYWAVTDQIGLCTPWKIGIENKHWHNIYWEYECLLSVRSVQEYSCTVGNFQGFLFPPWNLLDGRVCM